MAYFSNSGEGSGFDEQCGRCKHGEGPCPIAFVQMAYNYEACNDKVATKILDELVKQDGTCTVFEMAKRDFASDGSQEEFPYPPSLRKYQLPPTTHEEGKQ